MGLVGRDAEQEAVRGLINHARGGRSGVLALVAEPGMGKSALLEYAADQAEDMHLLRARGVQSEARIPFAGLSELLRPALGFLDRIPGRQAAALEGALALIPARAEDRFAVGAATLSLLAAWAERQPVLVMVDDAHWIDGSSSDALSFAFRRLIADPIAVVLGVREGEPSLLDSGDLARLRLRGLDLSAAGALIKGAAGPASDDVIERIHRHTGGNPLALLEAAREIDQFHLGTPLDMPLLMVSRVSQAYIARTRALPSPSRMPLLLAAASDISDVATLARAAASLGMDISSLAAAEEDGLIDLREGRVEFRHPLIRSAVYGDAHPEQRRQVHRVLADVLPDADSDRRAWHLALASFGPDDAACSALEQAARRARDRSGYDVASQGFERAAQLAPDEARQARLLYQAADAAWSAGHASQARTLLDRAEQHTTALDAVITIGHLRGQIATRVGPVGDGLSLLVAAASKAVATDPQTAVVMFAEAVNAAFYAGDATAMRDAATCIAAVGPQPPGSRAQFFGVMAQGMALTFSGQTDRGALLLRQAVQQADSAESKTEDPRWLTWAAMGALWLRERTAGRALIERATDVARSRTAIGVLPYHLSHVAIDLATTDRWAEAEAIFHEVIDLARETEQRTDLAAALARLAWLEARQGKQEQCRRHAGEAIRLGDELGLRLCQIWALAALGDLCLAHGHSDEAVAHLSQQVTLLGAGGIADVDLSPAPELVELHLRVGAVDVATQLAAAYEDEAAIKGQPWALARAARCRGLLAAEGDIDHAFTQALETHSKTPDVFESARTHLAYGARLRRARQRVRARQQLRAAIDIFDALGADPWSAMARAELAATGETARQRNPSTRSQLTPQELQISLLLAAKHTTRETAAALFISPKTVEYHLRNVYRKLGCNTREELAVAMNSSGHGEAGAL